VFGFIACEKIDVAETSFVASAVTARSGEGTTILGAQRTNPFTTARMADAYRSLYGTSILEMPVTDLYIKFTPNTDEHMAELAHSDLFLLDFPLEYEVIEMGCRYQPVSPNSFPTLYCTVNVGQTLPNVPYEVIDDLYLDDTDHLLVAESYRLTGNSDLINDYVFGEGMTEEELGADLGNIVSSGGGGAIPDPPIPVCQPGYHPVMIFNDSDPNPPYYIWVCVADPPPPPATTNNCGCTLPSNRRFPAGCVNVEDTEFSSPGAPTTFEGVRRVKVIAINLEFFHFKINTTETDDNGCWQIEKSYYGQGRYWVQFKNERCNLRVPEGNIEAVWQSIFTAIDYAGIMHGPDFNHQEANYGMWWVSENGSETHRNWAASTLNNAVHEFHDFAVQDGINPPPNHLDIIGGHNHAYGYCLMNVQHDVSATAAAILASGSSFILGPFSVLAGASIGIIIDIYLPDIFIGTNFRNSDRQKKLAYHELAHASHYSQAGHTFWAGLVSAEIIADGHGNENSQDAGLIALCESWAEHIGIEYANQKYPPDLNNDRSTLVDGTVDWMEYHERIRNETDNHIPIGIYHDLTDNVHDILQGCDKPTELNSTQTAYIWTECGSIDDDISGITNAQIFSQLTNQVSTIEIFYDNVLNNILPGSGNSPEDLNDLIESY